jgi:membrane protein implicated in regulation of membrane protease activity
MFRKTERDAKRRNTVSDEIRDEETEATEDVEGHGLVGEPGAASPAAGRSDAEDGDDVEAHGLIAKPNTGQPNTA